MRGVGLVRVFVDLGFGVLDWVLRCYLFVGGLEGEKIFRLFREFYVLFFGIVG